MGLHRVMFISIAFLLFLSTQATFCRTSNFNYKNDEPLKLPQHLHLTSTQCRSAVHCAVACFSSPGCVLADLESGDLYKHGRAHVRKIQVTRMVRKYVEPQVDRGDEHVTLSKEVTSLLMVSEYGGSMKAKNLYKVSIKSNTTERTGITVKDRVISIVYDRKSNTVFWSKQSGIFKQIMDSHSKKIKISTGRNADNLNIYNGNLLFCINVQWQGSIYAQDLKNKNKDLWLSEEKNRIYRLAIDGDLACWNQCGTGHSINCAEMSSKKIIYTKPQPQSCRRKLSELALVKTSNFSMLVYGMKDEEDKFTIKVVGIAPGGQFSNPKTVENFEKERRINIFPGSLVFSVEFSNEVEIWQISQNGSIGIRTFSTRCLSARSKSTILVALI